MNFGVTSRVYEELTKPRRVNFGSAQSSRFSLIQSDREIFAELGCLLHRTEYVRGVLQVVGDCEPHLLRRWAREHAGHRLTEGSAEQRTLVSLLFLGRPLPVGKVQKSLGPLLRGLIWTGLLECRGARIYCDRYILVVVEQQPFIVSRLKHTRSRPGSVAVYFGRDTLELVRHVQAAQAAERS